MASEETLIQVLDLLTIAPQSDLESLSAGASADVQKIRRVVRAKNVVAVGVSEKITQGKSTGTSDYLKALGAHAVLVDKVKGRGDEIKPGSDEELGVIAFVEKKPSDVPKELEIESGGKKKKIPLAVKIRPMASLEQTITKRRE